MSPLVILRQDRRLNRRSRQEVLAAQPDDYRDFRRLWSEIRDASGEFIPDAGQPAGDLSFLRTTINVN